MLFWSAPSGGESGAGPVWEVSEAGRLITKLRRWWRKGTFTATFQSTGYRITVGKEVVKRVEKKKSGQPCRYPDFYLCVVLSGNVYGSARNAQANARMA